MELIIHGHNLDITTRINNYVEKKVERIDRYMPKLSNVTIDLSSESTRSAVERYVAQITIRDDRGTILRAEERSSDIFAAIDAVVDKLYRQIERYRGKKKKKYRGIQEDLDLGEPLPLDEEEAIDSSESNIVRTKRFTLYPMSTEEAVDQMELLGHDFFVFFNAEEDAINVIYRRHDGDYGLLQPEFA
jgi:putative sigma-54 modulation protein